jgi:murein DD-endopeptidase MepM/ murein hydrolase activator NlpD
VPIGTPVEAALAGTVLATGDTDLAHDAAGDQCYSFGKWIMLEHDNGLNTMYAHLSVISVTKGQSVSQGDVIGYSGMTGYATGPHLHFGVYATAGVKILTLGEFRGATTPCENASMPVAPADAYLNPLSYLP